MSGRMYLCRIRRLLYGSTFDVLVNSVFGLLPQQHGGTLSDSLLPIEHTGGARLAENAVECTVLGAHHTRVNKHAQHTRASKHITWYKPVHRGVQYSYRVQRAHATVRAAHLHAHTRTRAHAHTHTRAHVHTRTRAQHAGTHLEQGKVQ